MNDEFFMLFCVFAEIWIKATNSDHEFSAGETVAGLFGNAETGSDAIPVKQFIEILSMKNSNPCESMLMHLLAKKPLDVGNEANGWGDISTITVREFLSKKVAVGSGRASTMMDQMNGHIRGSCHDFVTETMPMIGMQIYDPVEFVRKLSLTQNSENAKKSGLKLLEGLLDTPLLDVVKPPLAANGFRLNLRMDFFSYVSSHFDKIIVDNHPISNGYSISLYRTKLDYDDEVKIHRVVATVTDSTGALAGFADATFIKNPYGTLSYLGSVLDDAQLSDCNELALAATFDYEFGIYHRFEKMLFITSWEVSSHHRRKGIGRALIDAILTDGIKGLGKPQTVLSAVRPTGYVVPPLAEEGGDNFSNYASDLRVVQEAWGECVIKNKALKGLKITYVNAEYNPIFHGLGNLEILALMTYQMIDY
ncbi:GNAT family N-acetyltransferase (plasmid) [Pseudomonas sp. Leaf58]|nr:GNAT family N-acetyltransferase [Pseudomonas sp. Leaf58]KQN62214.1 hypothetical protein ASF02_08605 [Pseudomonas sp. Leaf58]